jgi:hypothetical protein
MIYIAAPFYTGVYANATGERKPILLAFVTDADPTLTDAIAAAQAYLPGATITGIAELDALGIVVQDAEVTA